MSVLTKGLSFVPNPTKTLKQEINKSCSKLKQNFFRNRIQKKQPTFKKKSNWIPPPSDNQTLISFFIRVEQKLGSISTLPWKTYSDLTLKEKIALNDLKNNRSIVIKRFDKDGCICIMNTRD